MNTHCSFVRLSIQYLLRRIWSNEFTFNPCFYQTRRIDVVSNPLEKTRIDMWRPPIHTPACLGIQRLPTSILLTYNIMLDQLCYCQCQPEEFDHNSKIWPARQKSLTRSFERVTWWRVLPTPTYLSVHFFFQVTPYTIPWPIDSTCM